MRQLFALLFFVGVACASTIPVTGSGSFALDNFKDTSAFACFSGSNGSASVSVCANGIPIGPQPPQVLDGSSLTSPQMSFSDASVDGVTSTRYELAVGGYGANYVALLDSAGNILLSEDISGYIHITGYQENGPRWIVPDLIQNDNWQASGTFVITSSAADPIVPEPGSGLLLSAGLLGAAWLRKMQNRSEPRHAGDAPPSKAESR